MLSKKMIAAIVFGGLIAFGIIWGVVQTGKSRVTDKVEQRSQYINELLESGQ